MAESALGDGRESTCDHADGEPSRDSDYCADGSGGQSHHSKLTWRRLSETGETSETVYFSNTGVCV